ncbi:MAG TPA: protein translocase subunit SecF [Deltaproteobacteria bacterium]|jgi:preprotein translocase subunit SecF|nr:protein translocase subunit SecF [Deltaproteobacteria bacterium]HRW79228.1 protein translocase subunit SecF [Desulfomonilia bacterium]HNQ86829.1 protein translocase subunit SecF [Deltaproteobacteria bacterium]HNS89408.1 protein translocase subunit SecF [Deltaproteobacteria bacterium]HON96085.1 protein translocase subunit SecF [Deltaproteobacteria bacterium]
MELIRPGFRVDFIGYRKYAYILSGILIAISLASLFFIRGLNYGIDFAGGLELQVAFKDSVETGDVRNAMRTVGLEQAAIQSVSGGEANEFLIRMHQIEEDPTKSISTVAENALFQAFGKEKVDIRRAEVVGAAVSKDLKTKGLLSILYACIGLLVYIWIRFELSYSVGAIAALVHDVIITMGLFSLLQKEMSLTIIAALLTIVGYSLNDTIVIFDRIRENIKKQTGSFDLASLMSDSISQTLSRTVLTALTVFLVALCLFLLGGNVIHDFAFAMLVGVVVGTYSSMYIASPIVLLFSRVKK